MMKAPLKPTTGSPEHDAFVRRMSLVFIGAAFFVMTSQNVMAPNLTAVADSFGLDSAGRDTILGGWMSTAFFLIGGPMSVVVGYLVDVSNRKDLFLSVMFLGNAVILLNAVASTIWQLVVLRALLGAVLGGVLPLLYSIFGDLFPPARRSTVSALVGTASGAGVLIGQVLSGLVGSSYGWRSPYVLISMLGFGAMYLVKVFGEEPARGMAEDTFTESGKSVAPGTKAEAADSVYNSKLDWASVKRVFAIKTNLLIFAQALPGTIPWGVILVFLNDYLSQDKGMSVKQATFIVLLFGIGAAVGGLVGGVTGQRVYNHDSRLLPVFIGICQIVAVVPMTLIFNIQLGDPSGAEGVAPDALPKLWIIAVIAGIFSSVAGPNLKAMLLNVNTPETRGTVFCCMYLADSFGKGVGPYVVSRMIQHFGSRSYVFNLAMLGWVASGSLITAVALVLKRDESEARARIRSSMTTA